MLRRRVKLSGQGRSRATPKQLRASARKKRLRAEREAELAAEASRLGITVWELRVRLYKPVVAALDARRWAEQAAMREAETRRVRERREWGIYRGYGW